MVTKVVTTKAAVEEVKMMVVVHALSAASLAKKRDQTDNQFCRVRGQGQNIK